MKEPGQCSILIVDDDPEVVDFAASYFRYRGLRVLCATTGEEAIRIIRENRIALMITDLHMPGMNGLELAEEARKIAPLMLVVMVTADVSPEVRRRAVEAGIARVFGKPFLLEEVFRMAGMEDRVSVPP